MNVGVGDGRRWPGGGFRHSKPSSFTAIAGPPKNNRYRVKSRCCPGRAPSRPDRWVRARWFEAISPPGPAASEHWKDKPEAQDVPAAKSYLSFLVGPEAASKVARALRKERSLKDHAAKDILRAANLALLGPQDPEVAADLNKVKLGDRLSPVLLVQGEPLWVAGGYQRICASYHLDEKTEVMIG